MAMDTDAAAADDDDDDCNDDDADVVDRSYFAETCDIGKLRDNSYRSGDRLQGQLA